MNRIEQVALIGAFLMFSWLAMQAVHELGHVVGAWLTGADVVKVALHPSIISRTDLGHNPRPLIVVWAGPLVGSLLPLAAFFAAKACRSPGVYLFRFFAGFCLVANGVYIAFGPSGGGADTGVMMEHGSPRWLMALFGLISIPGGFFLWRNQGREFGFADANGRVSRSAAVVSALLFMALAGAEWIINSR